MNAQEASKIACDKIYADNKEAIDKIINDVKFVSKDGYSSLNFIKPSFKVSYQIKYYFEKLGYRFNIFNNNSFDISW